MIASDTPIDLPTEQLSRVYRLLASLERGDLKCRHSAWSDSQLQTRILTLAIHYGLLSPNQTSLIAPLIRFLNQQFLPGQQVALQQIRRSIRKWRASRSQGPATSKVDQDQIERWLAISPGTQSVNRDASAEISAAARRTCAEALLNWQTSLADSTYWTQVGGLTPVDDRENLEEVYIQTRLATGAHQQLESFPANTDWSQRTREHLPATTIAEDMFSCTRKNYLVIGEPGAGKTTLIKRLAWATRRNRLHGFELAIAIKLSSFADAFAKDPSTGLLEFFLQSQLPNQCNVADAARCLKDAAENSGQFLLLLDGWNEVPSHLQESVHAAIVADSKSFTTVTTTRKTGFSCCASESTDIFEMAGLDDALVKQFIERRTVSIGLGTAAADEIYERIESRTDCASMAANPFLLGMLMRLVHGPTQLSLADIFQQIVAWLTDQSRRQCDWATPPVTTQLRSLEKLAYKITVKEMESRQIFPEDELELDATSPDAIQQSRFIYRISGLTNHWVFLHPTIQAFLAARELARQPRDVMTEQWKRLACSCCRLLTLEVFAGMSESTRNFSAARTMEMLADNDRFGIITTRLAKIAWSANWRTDQPVAWNAIVDQLWIQISNGADLKLVNLSLESLQRLAPDELRRRSMEKKRLPAKVQGLIRKFVDDQPPPPVASRPGSFSSQPVSPVVRLATICADDDPLPLLEDLVRTPAPHALALAAEFAVDRDLSEAVRAAAIDALTQTTGHHAGQAVVRFIVREPNLKLVALILTLALKHSIPVSTNWIEKTIAGYETPVRRPMTIPGFDQNRLLAIYLTQSTTISPDDLPRCRAFLEPRIHRALLGVNQFRQDDAREISVALSLVGDCGRHANWPYKLIQLARYTLNRGLCDSTISLGRLRLAFQLLRFGYRRSVPMGTLLETLLRRRQYPGSCSPTVEIDNFAQEVAQVMSTSSLNELLQYPPHIACVRNVLRDLSVQRGATIFSTRAYDGQGRCIGDLTRPACQDNDDSIVAVRNSMLRSLPPMQHRALKSFQIVVEYIGPDATYEEIHSAIDSYDEVFPAVIKENLEDLYQGVDFPNLAAWRRSLNHAAQKLEASIDGQNLLKELGLPRR